MTRNTNQSHWPPKQLLGQRPHIRAVLWAWTGTRPWVAGLITCAAGMIIAVVPNADISVVVIPGVAGLSGLFLGTLLVASALFLVSSPQIHALIGIAIVLLSLLSFISSNLGGLLVGMIMGLIGGSLGFGWQPPPHQPPR